MLTKVALNQLGVEGVGRRLSFIFFFFFRFSLLHTHTHTIKQTKQILSTGGFSAVFQRPAYQDEGGVVENYLSTSSLPKSSLFDSTGRALPDVSALSTNFAVFSGGQETGTLTGTSAATPTFAGLLSVLNDELVASGKKTLGFINPTLYATKGGVNLGYDITSGNNKYSNCPAGFPAVKGWDAVSGFGTPSMAILREVLTGGASST